MDSMFGENKNLKDSKIDQSISLRDNRFFLSYSKVNKLISALYMVTDVLEEKEPIRHKLRTLGIDMVSDISNVSENKFVLNAHYLSTDKVNQRIHEIVSLLEIAFSLNLISGMNFNILKKEFLQLRDSIQKEHTDPFILGLLKEEEKSVFKAPIFDKGQNSSIGQNKTRIGVQKGSTLLEALSKIELSDRIADKALINKEKDNDFKRTVAKSNVLKDKRREEIILIIKDKVTADFNIDGITISEIKNNLKGDLASSSEKTLQRELAIMVEDGILRKTGKKRWSTYSLNNTKFFLKSTKTILS